MTKFRQFALAAMAAPLTLALAACADDATSGNGLSGEPIAAIPAPEGQSWTQTASTTQFDGVVVGNPEAAIKLVEYASHTCPACANFNMEAHDALNEYIATGVVSVELRNQVHDPLDLTIAMLVRCGGPATFQPLAAQAWSNLNSIRETALGNWEAFNAELATEGDDRFQRAALHTGLLDFFAARGISRDQALSCLADPAVAERIINNSQTQSEELGVTGTPTFFINGTRLDGASWASVEAALQTAGAR